MSTQLDALAQLHPDIQSCVVAFIDAFPGSAIASGRRSIDEQAQADAALEVRYRRPPPGSGSWIAFAYAPTLVRTALVACSEAHPSADVAELAARFAAILGAFSDDALAHFSLHLSGRAVDLAPVHGDNGAIVADLAAREAWCRDYLATSLGIGRGDPVRSKVLTDEAGNRCLHVQLWPKEA